VAKFRYLGTTITNQNLIQQEIKRRLNPGNACYYSVQKLMSSRLLSKNVKFRIYKTIILPVVLYGYQAWCLTLRQEHRLKVFENKRRKRRRGRRRRSVDTVRLHTGAGADGYANSAHTLIGSEVVTPVVMKSSIFWDITPCSTLKVN
jgi:hypothetical protein